MSDIRGYTSIAEHADPAVLAQQLNRHRAEMNRAILGAGGTVMQYVGDAVMAVFGAPEATDDHAERALDAAEAMHAAQHAVNAEWAAEGRAPFGIGIGLSTGVVAAALLGSEERVEYTVVGDAVNLCQRLQQFAEPGQTVLSEATWHIAPLTTGGGGEARTPVRQGSRHPGCRLSHRPGTRKEQPDNDCDRGGSDHHCRRRDETRRRSAVGVPHVRTGHGTGAGPAWRRPAKSATASSSP